MSAPVKLMVKDGKAPIKEYVITHRTSWTVGRSWDCALHFPNDAPHWMISRHHCQLYIDPPVVRVRDLGSRNGTFVNGRKIGQRTEATTDSASTMLALPGVELHPGDEVQLGPAVLQVAPGTPGDAP